jgi:hypothetical protein
MNIRLLIVCLIASLVAGCATNAPQYSASVANIDAAAKLPGSVAVGKFDFKKGEEARLNSVGARADTFTSPVNGSYADYLAEAAKADLKGAGKLDPASPRVLTGTIEKNDLSAASLVTNYSDVTVKFKLADGASTAYEKTLTMHHEWESSFLGGIAIPRAIQNYVVTLQKLLNKLYSDPDFASAAGKR